MWTVRRRGATDFMMRDAPWCNVASTMPKGKKKVNKNKSNADVRQPSQLEGLSKTFLVVGISGPRITPRWVVVVVVVRDENKSL